MGWRVMAAIGDGWVDGAWVEAGWTTGAWLVGAVATTAKLVRGMLRYPGRMFNA